MTTNTIIIMLLVSMLALFLLKVPVYISMSLAVPFWLPALE